MKILALSNFYPPDIIGGYEALCCEAVEWLGARGHDVHVVTSTYGCAAPVTTGRIRRVLSLEGPIGGYAAWRILAHRRQARRNSALLRRIIAEIEPDLLFVWCLWNMSRDMLAELEAADTLPIVHYLASPWPLEPSIPAQYWDAPARRRAARLPKRLGAALARAAVPGAWNPAPLRFDHGICNTASLRDQLVRGGQPLANAPLVCEGVDLTPYRDSEPPQRGAGAPLEVAFVGRLGAHKGAHTVIEAVGHLVNRRGRDDVRLTICGGGLDDYKQRLRDLVRSAGVEAYVTFQRPIPRTALPAFLARFDVLTLPSIWDEALARIMQEGLAAARTLVATPTGATPEFLVDGENALLFPPGDGAALAERLARVADDPALARRLAAAGKQTALRHFDLERMMRQLESALEQAVAPPASGAAGRREPACA